MRIAAAADQPTALLLSVAHHLALTRSRVRCFQLESLARFVALKQKKERTQQAFRANTQLLSEHKSERSKKDFASALQKSRMSGAWYKWARARSRLHTDGMQVQIRT